MPYTVTFEGPDDLIQEGLLLYAKSEGWSETLMVDDGRGGEASVTNPETAEVFARRKLKRYVLERITKYQQAVQARKLKKQLQKDIETQFDAVS